MCTIIIWGKILFCLVTKKVFGTDWSQSLFEGIPIANECGQGSCITQILQFNRYDSCDLHFCAPLKSALSLGVSPTSIILAPASSCMMRPEVTMGEIPSSINVPEIYNTTFITSFRGGILAKTQPSAESLELVFSTNLWWLNSNIVWMPNHQTVQLAYLLFKLPVVDHIKCPSQYFLIHFTNSWNVCQQRMFLVVSVRLNDAIRGGIYTLVS